MTRVYLSLGTNLGDRQENLRRAVACLQREFDLFAVSNLWETEPWGNVRQSFFLNLVLGLDTYVSIEKFFARCQAIEGALGKWSSIFWGPRIIDIDLIFWEYELYRTSHLIVPHPYWHQREFVLRPLSEVAPLMNPGEKSLSFWIRHCRVQNGSQGLRCIGELEGIKSNAVSPLTYEEIKRQGLTLKGIVAVDNHDGMACKGEIPWHLPEDRSFFREKTRDGILCMGRKTMEQLPYAFNLEERELWILSRTLPSCERYPDALIFHHPEEMRDAKTDRTIWICGGKEVYEQFLPLCEEVYVTRLFGDYGCDTVLDSSWKRWLPTVHWMNHCQYGEILCYGREADCTY
jgi:2-amino-4-hydroxy-6-hydroxymethyldihydropteridine diphosphokinase